MEKEIPLVMSPVIKILIAEDYAVNRLGLKVLLDREDGFEVVGEAVNGEKCVLMAADLKPTVVLMDIRMPLMDGIDATKQIKECAPETKVIVLTSHSDQNSILSSLAVGADGYCLKDARSSQLMLAIRAVAGGACWLDPGIASVLLRNALPGRSPASLEPKPEALTANEIGVLKLVVEGLNNPEIARRLFISVDTVKSHMNRIFIKMSVPGRTQAAIKAVKDGLV